MLVVCLADGLHDQLTSLHHTSEEDECLGRREGSKVGTGLTQHLSCEFVDLLGQFVALAGSDGHIERSDLLGIQLTQQRRTVCLCQQLTRRAGYTSGRAVALQTTGTTTAAGAAFLTAYHRHMT